MKNAKCFKLVLGATALLAASFFLAACKPLEDDSQSGSLLLVEKITGTDSQGKEVDFLQSDVVRFDALTGILSWRADAAKATLSASMLDPDPLLGPSQYNDIQVSRYVVSYTRADGHNIQGADVPYSFEGGLSILIRVGTPTVISFVIVPEVAKQQAPLLNLYQGNPGDILNVTAKVEFYGRDLANKTVKATGYLTVYFANYVDQ